MKGDESTIDTSIEAIVGVNLDDLGVQVTNVWKMVWEQVILLALYSRKQYVESGNESEALNFRQRIKLIHTIDNLMTKDEHVGIRAQCREIIEKVESNSGSNEVLALLFDDTNDRKIPYGQQNKTIKKIIRDEIEKEGIAFPSSSKEMQYSYYAMYKSLKDLIPLLQIASSYDEPNVRQQFYSFIRVVISKEVERGSSYSLEEQLINMKDDGELTDAQYIEMHLDTLTCLMSQEQSKTRIIEDFYSQLIIGEEDVIDKNILGIGKWAKKVFSFTILGLEQEEESTNDLYEISESSTENIVVEFNKTKLKDMMHLGLLKSIFDNLAFECELRISEEKSEATIKDFISQNTNNALHTISDWYTYNNVGLFIRSNQIPKLIVYLISFDINKHKGIYDPSIGGINLNNPTLRHFKNPKKASEKNLQVSLVMKYCLYHSINPNFLYTDKLRKVQVDSSLKTAEQSIKIIQDLNKLIQKEGLDSKDCIVKNKLFEDWANLLEMNQGEIEPDSNIKAYNRIINRFKRMPEYNLSNGSSVDYFSEGVLDKLVKDQKHQKNSKESISYPFNINFPLPLWIKKIR